MKNKKQWREISEECVKKKQGRVAKKGDDKEGGDCDKNVIKYQSDLEGLWNDEEQMVIRSMGDDW